MEFKLTQQDGEVLEVKMKPLLGTHSDELWARFSKVYGGGKDATNEYVLLRKRCIELVSELSGVPVEKLNALPMDQRSIPVRAILQCVKDELDFTKHSSS